MADDAPHWLEAVARKFEPDRYANDPVLWAKEKLGIHLWSKQREIVETFMGNRRTAVKSCHNSGKSFLASVLAAWWIDVHPPGEAFVASTAPSYPQVHAILWEEIRKRHRAGKLTGRVLQSDEWKLSDGTLVGYGRKPADEDEHGFQGIHRRYVLVILDEACGVPESLWTGAETITTNADCRILAIGNPDDPNTEFGKVCKPGSGWASVKISAFDTPLFTGEDIPEAMGPLMLDPSWVDDKRRRWGIESPRYTSKILGEFPDIGEDTLIPPSLIEAAQERRLAPASRAILAVDVARFGADRTVIARAAGPVFRVVADHAKEATTETTGRVVAEAREEPVDAIHVDGVGVGGGVVDMLVEQGWPVIDMQSGAGSLDPDHFLNARAQWWWAVRKRFEAGDIDIDPADEELAAQLGSVKFKYTSRGQIQIESKADMKKRGLPSPDRADTVMLAYATLPSFSEEIVEPDEFDDEFRRIISRF